MRAFAIRALGDRRGEVPDTARPVFVKALTDPDPRVALEAISALRRMGATDAAAAMLPLAASKDPVIANVAVNALVALAAVDAPLAAVKGASDEVANGSLRVLQQIHQPAVVTGLIGALSQTKVPARRSAILQALARLHNREGVWRGTLGEWWGTRPDTTGPYYDPVAWEESPRIRGVLLTALVESTTSAGSRDAFNRLATDLQRNRVLPPGGADLLTAMAADRHASLNDVARMLVGRVRFEIDPSTGPLLDRVARANPRYRGAIASMIVAAGPPSPAAGAILLAAAIDPSLTPEVRASAFSALASAPGPDALPRSIDAFTSLVAPTLDAPLEAVWTQFISSPAHAENVAAFRDLARSDDRARRRLAYAVLIQLAADPPAAGRGARGGGGRGGGGRGRGGVNPAVVESARAEARTIIDAAWKESGAADLVWATGRTGAVRYRDRVAELTSSSSADVRETALDAMERLDAAAPSATAPASAAAPRPTVASVPYEQLAGQLASITGDVALGRKLFAQQGCNACHTTTPAEPEKGPYLGGIFTRYSRAEVIESILRPGAKVAQGFATYSFTTTDKRQLSGFVIREGQNDVVIRDLAGAETTLRKSEIAARSAVEGSLHAARPRRRADAAGAGVAVVVPRIHEREVARSNRGGLHGAADGGGRYCWPRCAVPHARTAPRLRRAASSLQASSPGAKRRLLASLSPMKRSRDSCRR